MLPFFFLVFDGEREVCQLYWSSFFPQWKSWRFDCFLDDFDENEPEGSENIKYVYIDGYYDIYVMWMELHHHWGTKVCRAAR